MCGVCGSREFRTGWTICDRRSVVCADCGVHRLYDRVAEHHLDLLYGDYYAKTDLPAQQIENQLANPTFQHRRVRLEQAVGARGRRILEIGCGDGNFLAVMRRAGWDVHGSEFGADAADLVQRRHQIPVLVGDIAKLPADLSFQVVAAYHVLEHVYHPVAWLQRVRQMIEPDGLLHIQVPNDASLVHAVTGRAWASIVFPQHVYFYTPATLRLLLERFGFSVLTMTTWDPWHGPGAVASSVTQAVNRLVTGRLPWTDRLERQRYARVNAPTVRSRYRGLRSLGRLALDRVSVPLARVEAGLGRGAVIDIVAKRQDPARGAGTSSVAAGL